MGALLDVVDEVPAVIVAVLEGRRQWMHACWPVSALAFWRVPSLRGSVRLDGPWVTCRWSRWSVWTPLSLRDVDSPEDLDESGRAGL